MGTSKRLAIGGEGDVLRSWWTLNADLNKRFNEDEVRRLLEFEASNQGRARFLNRLHGRLSEMVRVRERAALLRKAKDARKRSKKVKRKATKRAKPTAAQRPTMKRKPKAVLAPKPKPKPKRVRKPKIVETTPTSGIEETIAAA